MKVIPYESLSHNEEKQPTYTDYVEGGIGNSTQGVRTIRYTYTPGRWLGYTADPRIKITVKRSKRLSQVGRLTLADSELAYPNVSPGLTDREIEDKVTGLVKTDL